MKLRTGLNRIFLHTSQPRFSPAIFYSAVATTLVLVAMGGISYHFYRQHAERNGPSAIKNLIQINQLQADLTNLESTVSSSSELSTKEISGINQKLSEIHHEIDDLSNRTGLVSNESIQKIQKDLETNDATLNQKLLSLGSEIQAIKTQLNPPKTLLEEALSFAVESVDLWNGRPYAQVEQKSDPSKISYVGLNQSIGAWKVAEISAPLQSVTFVNRENQFVHVQVNDV